MSNENGEKTNFLGRRKDDNLMKRIFYDMVKIAIGVGALATLIVGWGNKQWYEKEKAIALERAAQKKKNTRNIALITILAILSVFIYDFIKINNYKHIIYFIP